MNSAESKFPRTLPTAARSVDTDHRHTRVSLSTDLLQEMKAAILRIEEDDRLHASEWGTFEPELEGLTTTTTTATTMATTGTGSAISTTATSTILLRQPVPRRATKLNANVLDLGSGRGDDEEILNWASQDVQGFSTFRHA